MSESNITAPEATVATSSRESRRAVAAQHEKNVENTWKKLMNVAHHHIALGKLDDNGRSSTDPSAREGFYNRERQMVIHLETLFGLTHTHDGYLAFVSALTRHLDYDNPVAMAFLSHVIERSALPGRTTLKQTSSAILENLNRKPGRLHRMVSILIEHYRLSAKKELVRKQIADPSVVDSFVASSLSPEQIKLKINSAAIWCFLAERYAGELSTYIYQENVGCVLFDSVINRQEELLVRVYSLVALEKFAVTEQCKIQIEARSEEYGLNIRQTLTRIIHECDEATVRIHLLSYGEHRPICNLFTPPSGPLREEWSKYTQLKMCCQWALDHAFKEGPKLMCQWSLTRQRVIMNPYDATAGLKFTNNGLELRNDRIHFESSRATACVRKGKWFYEAQLMSHGIIQIGWATSRCRFAPDEGFGVGDDCHGFAFDTFRSAVWAGGVCVHPNTNHRVRCSVGDVVGTLLDLDNGTCTFYINGKDVGMTVEFENPKKAPKTEPKKRTARPTSRPVRSTPTTAPRPTSSVTPNTVPRNLDSVQEVDQHPPNSLANDEEVRSTAQADATARAEYAASAAEAEAAANAAARIAAANAAAARAAASRNAAANAAVSRAAITNAASDNTVSSSTTANAASSSAKIDIPDNKIPRSRSTIKSRSLAFDQRHRKRNSSVSRANSITNKGIGLYPAVSLTTGQHIRVNFGDEPWMYRPPITYAYWGINQAGELDEYYKKRVLHWADKRGKISHGKYFGPTNTQPLRPRYGADNIPEGQLIFSDSSDDEAIQDDINSDNDDAASKDQCNICYSEPANVILQPCKHGDIGSQCAALIKKCPLCRTPIYSREVRRIKK